jgi:hypothetical protein
MYSWKENACKRPKLELVVLVRHRLPSSPSETVKNGRQNFSALASTKFQGQFLLNTNGANRVPVRVFPVPGGPYRRQSAPLDFPLIAS